MPKFTKESLEKLRKELFPFHYRSKDGSAESTVVSPIHAYDSELEGFDEICKERGITVGSRDYDILKNLIGGNFDPDKYDARVETLLKKYFPEYGVKSVTINTKRQSKTGMNNPPVYKTIHNYEMDASKIIKKNLPGGNKLSVVATEWPGASSGSNEDRIKALNAFWDMVCNENKVRTVVCLENPKESAGRYCYWDSNNYCSGGTFETNCYKVVSSKRSGTITSDAEIYDLEVEYTPKVGGSKKYKIEFYFYKEWPDGKIPSNPDNFEKFVRHLHSKNIKRFVIHCHAGAGRTGVLAACLYALKTGEKDAAKIIKELRKYRTQMVQHAGQFEFVCKFVLRNNANEMIKYNDDLDDYLQKNDVEI